MSALLQMCASGWEDSELVPRIKNPWSRQFRSPSADVIFKSCDGVLFKIHSQYLRLSTDDLEPFSGMSLHEPVELVEDSETLELLFRFVYPIQQPDLRWLEFDTLAKLAEAAEKYQVHPATMRCKYYMGNFVTSYPTQIFNYASRHGHKYLLNSAAYQQLKQPVEISIRSMALDDAVLWVRYYETWNFIRLQMLQTLCQNTSMGGPSDKWTRIQKLHSDLTLIQNFSNHAPIRQREAIDLSRDIDWERTDLNVRKLVREIPPFSGVERTSTCQSNQETCQRTGMTEAPKYYPSPFSDDSGVILCSSDGRRFFVHDAVLKLSNTKITVPEEPSGSDIVLPEDGPTLDLLLQFIHKTVQPDLADLDFDSLKSLALAAHKYKVNYAMSSCRDHMRKFLRSHSLSMLVYGLRVSDYEFMDIASHFVLDMNPKDVVYQVPDEFLVIWTEYYALYTNAAKTAFDILLHRLSEQKEAYRHLCEWCPRGDKCRDVLLLMAEGVAGFRKLKVPASDLRAENPTCDRCDQWVRLFFRASSKKIEPFSHFVKKQRLSLTSWMSPFQGWLM